MLSLLWYLPLALAAAAIWPLWLGASRLADEAAELRVATDELARLRPLVAEVRAEIAVVGRRAPRSSGLALHDLGRR